MTLSRKEGLILSDARELAREKRRKMMLEEPMMKVIPTVAIPMIISSMIDSIYNLADTFFVSQLGMNATAAVAVNDSLMNILRAISMGFAFGAASYISRLMGSKADEKASKVATTTLICGCVFSLFVGMSALCFKEEIVELLGVTQSAKQYSMDYAMWILMAAPFTTANLIMNQLLRSEGSTTYAMVGMCSGCFLNILLDPFFISVLGWEVAGAAFATALSKVFSCIVLAIPYWRKTAMLEIKLKYFELSNDIVKEVAKMGIPAFLRMSLMSIGGVITNHVAKGFGTAVLAAISVANKIYKLIASAIMGFSQGFGPVAGFCWGAKKYKRVKESYLTTLKIGGTCALILGTLMFIGSEPLVALFNSENDPTVVAVAVFKIRSLCLVFVPHIVVMVTSNLYQSLGKPIGNLVLSMSRQLLFLIPIVLILPNLTEELWGIGEYGLAMTQALSDLFSCIFLAIPLAYRLFKQIAPLKDGDEPNFYKN